MAGGSRFTVNPFPELVLTAEDRTELIQISHDLVMAKFAEYQEHINNQKYVDQARWKKYSKEGNMMMYLERKKANPESKLPALFMFVYKHTVTSSVYGSSGRCSVESTRSDSTMNGL
ncbi:hypothetical protein PR002_g5755 [Phytophthora rubi]|uniref:Uncharacterized protein n=1 Tax=Phytophthora rubi TaxID=129364 RepID=A0A6A3N0D8_9STRA|nr:hypothetical protein PR002_g5755 [Phytophthora rubi]